MKHCNKNGIDIIIKNNKKTPRIALVCGFLINESEKLAGIYSLFTKLLMQGTKKYSSVELAKIIEEKGIEINIRCKQDYFTASILTLNEDFDFGMEILSDILQNSTFENFDKEIHKLKGEIISELDSPRLLATDGFVRKIFDCHYYSNTYSRVLEDIDKIKIEDVKKILSQILNSKKIMTVVGDIEDEDIVLDKIADKFGFMKHTEYSDSISQVPKITGKKLVFKEKEDAKQAQVLKGWHFPTYTHQDYPKIIVMNNILGSAGLSSRLFVELRDKKGLAYTVRSSYEPLMRGAVLYFYIACDPSNIKNSLKAFDVELEKLRTIEITPNELQGAKENVLGRLEYFSQTNIQQAIMYCCNYLMNLSLDWEDKYRKMISEVTQKDIQEATQYFTADFVTSTVAPSEYKSLCN